MTGPRRDGYLPISAYGLIGDCRSAALVGEDGSLDWLCLPSFDAPSVFGAILDRRRGGTWRIAPPTHEARSQRYRDLSNILQTIWRTASGQVVVTDLMPVAEDTLSRPARLDPGIRVLRIVECLSGEVRMDSRIDPAPGYGATRPGVFTAADGRLHADVDGTHLCVRSTAPDLARRCSHTLGAGESVAFALLAERAGHCPAWELTMENALRLSRQTQEFWWRWSRRLRYEGPFLQPVHRSALALKAMQYAPTGALIAAPTTSLPEQLGGERNWDYRYTWLRDASFTLYAFFQLGLVDEAHDFFGWLSDIGVGMAGRQMENFYTIEGERSGEEHDLPHLEGYRGSRPVRVGNGAAQQLQLDVHGEVLDSAYLYARFGGEIQPPLWRELRAIVDTAIAGWQQPDCSIWEVRGGVQHFTYSTMMCWVAVDRGLRIAQRFGLPHDAAAWQSARRAMRRRILQRGWNPALGSFAQTLGGDSLDAALLRMSQVRFLPDHDHRLRSTVETIAERLSDGVLVRRYLVEETDDGLRGDEGAFLMCSFWLADSFAHGGEIERAQRLFERLLPFASPLGLLAEEADARTGELLGNYPQAFTHLALIGAAVNIERARDRRLGVQGLRGPRPASPGKART